MPVWWTKRSLPDSSGVMNPKPFSSENHLTVPVAMFLYLHGVVCCERGGAHTATCGCATRFFHRTSAPGEADGSRGISLSLRAQVPLVSLAAPHHLGRIEAAGRQVRGVRIPVLEWVRYMSTVDGEERPRARGEAAWKAHRDELDRRNAAAK